MALQYTGCQTRHLSNYIAPPVYPYQLIILSMQIKGYFAHVPGKQIQTNAAVTAPRYAKLANALFNSVLSYLTYLPFPLSISR